MVLLSVPYYEQPDVWAVFGHFVHRLVSCSMLGCSASILPDARQHLFSWSLHHLETIMARLLFIRLCGFLSRL